MDALITWEFWAGVLLAGVFALATLLRWILLGDGRSSTRLSSIDPPLYFQQSPLTHAHPDAAVAQLAPSEVSSLTPAPAP